MEHLRVRWMGCLKKSSRDAANSFRLYKCGSARITIVNQESEVPEIPVISCENARDKRNSSRALRDLEVNC